jgi:mono/diheme cytochrome c family protein
MIAIFTVILITLIPAAVVLNIRAAKSGSARWHVFFDMDFQPKKKPQTTTTLFADNRVQRPPVPGTIARGELELTDPFYLGYDPEATAALVGASNLRLVGFQQENQEATPQEVAPQEAAPQEPSESASQEQIVGEEPAKQEVVADAVAAAAPAAAEPTYAWLTEFPLTVDDDLFALGKAKYEQNCSVCHGYSGYGDGLVAKRAAELAQGYWLPPTSMHDSAVQKQPVGQIYYTITNGKGKMGSYAASLNPKERWAVVLYVRALQRSQNASEGDVPPGAAVNAPASAKVVP